MTACLLVQSYEIMKPRTTGKLWTGNSGHGEATVSVTVMSVLRHPSGGPTVRRGLPLCLTIKKKPLVVPPPQRSAQPVSLSGQPLSGHPGEGQQPFSLDSNPQLENLK